VLPYVQADDGEGAIHDRAVLVGQGDHFELIAFLDQPGPPGAEAGGGGSVELFLEGIERGEGCVDGLGEVPDRLSAEGLGADCAGAEDFPEQGVVVGAAAVVADGGLDRLGNDGQVVGPDLVPGLAVELRGLLQGLVVVGDVRGIVLAVVDFHRLLVDVRFQSIRRVWQRFGGEGHVRSPFPVNFSSAGACDWNC